MIVHCVILVSFIANFNYVLSEWTSNGYINDSVYALMPPLHRLDDYELCVDKPGGVYCTAKFDLVADEPNQIYDLIVEYSSYSKIHFNHSRLQYGVCLTETCKDFYNNRTTVGRKVALEQCLNQSFYDKYQLRTKIEETFCSTTDDPMVIETGDIVVAVVCLLVVLMNLVGSFYRIGCKDCKANGFLECFSIQQNYRRLVHPRKNVELDHLKGFYGLRSLNIIMVILVHAMLPFVISTDNPHFFERMYEGQMFQLILNGPLVIQIFLISSGFMLVYYLESIEEKRPVPWSTLPKGIILRYLRLTPPYAIVLAVTATWLRYAGSGPLWQLVVTSESDDCRKYWYSHLLYFNNYIDDSGCMIQSWYIAADLQLTILGLMAYVLVPRGGRIIAFSVLIVIGIITPAIPTYLMDEAPVLVVKPELSRHFFMHDPVLDNNYKRGHTNLVNYAMGLLTGLLVYRWRKTDFNFHKFIKSRYIYWALLPVAVGIVLLGQLFYFYEYPLELRVVYSALVRPAFGVCVCILIVGGVFKYENAVRGLMEWDGWRPLSQVTYCVYCIHMFLIRSLCGARTTRLHISLMQQINVLTSALVLSFVIAVPLWLFVEAPFAQLIKLITSGGGSGAKNDKNMNGTDNPAIDRDEKLDKERDSVDVKL